MHRSRDRVVVGLAAATLPLAFLAGCGEDEPKPKFEDPTSSAADPSDSASPEEPTKPTPPAAMKGDDVAGAKAFVEYYFDVWDYALTSGDIASLDELDLPSCTTCATVTESMRTAVKNNATIKGGEHTVDQSAFNPPAKQSSISIFQGNAKVTNTRQTIRGSGVKNLDGTYPQGKVTYALVLVHDKRGWHMSEWRLM